MWIRSLSVTSGGISNRLLPMAAEPCPTLTSPLKANATRSGGEEVGGCRFDHIGSGMSGMTLNFDPNPWP